MTYWRLHYHLIWATYEREPSITHDREKMFYGVLYNKSKALGLKVHAAGNVEDHIHLVLSIPPKPAVADCVRQLKGASAYAINHMSGSNGNFKWQEGYGALTVNDGSLEVVMKYAMGQKQHHCENRLMAVYETVEKD